MSRRTTVAMEEEVPKHADEPMPRRVPKAVSLHGQQSSTEIERIRAEAYALGRAGERLDAARQLAAANRRDAGTTDEHKHRLGRNTSASPRRASLSWTDTDDDDWSDDSMNVHIHSFRNDGRQSQPYVPLPVRTVCSPENPQDITVHLELPVSDDLDWELEEFARLRRMGNFKAAKEFFKHQLDEHIANPYVFVQYAETLLEMGDYKSFATLNPDPVLGSDLARPSAVDTGSDESDDERLPRRPIFASRPQHRRVDSIPLPASQARRVRWADRMASQDGQRESLVEELPRHSDRYPGPARIRERERRVSPERLRTRQIIDSTRRASRSTPYHVHLPGRDLLPAQYPVTTTGPKRDELQLLAWNWRLLNALAGIHDGGSLDQAKAEAVAALHELKFSPDICSTEVQLISLTLQICGHIKNCAPDEFAIDIEANLEDWVRFPALYRALLSQDRVWDFRDLVCAAFIVFGPKHWEMMTRGAVDEAIPGDFAHDIDEVACLALLDLLVSTTLELELTGDESNSGDGSVPTAQSLAECVMKNYPDAMRSRTFIRWILVKAAESSLKEDNGVPDSFQELFRHLESFSGMAFFRRDWITLPIYVPQDSEIPHWSVPEVPGEANEAVRMALNLAKDLDDYQTQALCYKLLLLRSQEPAALFRELSNLQKTVQQDWSGYLQTCLSSYIGCTDRQSQRWLLNELSDMEDWDGDSEIRDAEIYWAKDFIQRALSHKMDGGRSRRPQKISAVSMRYYGWLPSHARRFVDQALGIAPPRLRRSQSHTRTRSPDRDNQHDLERRRWEFKHELDQRELKHTRDELAKLKKAQAKEREGHEQSNQRRRTQLQLASQELDRSEEQQRELRKANNQSVSLAPAQDPSIVTRPEPTTAPTTSAPASTSPGSLMSKDGPVSLERTQLGRKDVRPLASSARREANQEAQPDERPILDSNSHSPITENRGKPFDGSEGEVDKEKQHAIPQDMQIIPWAGRSYYGGTEIQAEERALEIEGDSNRLHLPDDAPPSDTTPGKALPPKASKESPEQEAKSGGTKQLYRAEKGSLRSPERPNGLDGLSAGVQANSTGIWDAWNEIKRSKPRSRLADGRSQPTKRSGRDRLSGEPREAGKSSSAPAAGCRPEQDPEGTEDELHNSVGKDNSNIESQWGLSGTSRKKATKKKKKKRLHETENAAHLAEEPSPTGDDLHGNRYIQSLRPTSARKPNSVDIICGEPETIAVRSQMSGDDSEGPSPFRSTLDKPKKARKRGIDSTRTKPIETSNSANMIEQIQDGQGHEEGAWKEDQGSHGNISTAVAGMASDNTEDDNEPQGVQIARSGSIDIGTRERQPSRRPTVDDELDSGEGHRG